MNSESGKLVWRVRARDDAHSAAAFDALVLRTDKRGAERLGPSPRLLGAAVPYESELADAPLILVVRARADAGPLIVECEAIGPDGARQVYGRSSDPLAIIVRSTRGILVTGLPPVTPEPLAPAT